MTLFIEGPALRVGEKNLNNWGIKPEEVDNAINSLKSSVLKICPGEGHLCDYSNDPTGRIGKITDAWLEADWIHTKAQVTDSLAERKIKETTWDDLGWSTFGNGVLDGEGWASDFKAETMTLVRHPAWEKAGWKIAASKDDRTSLRTFSNFKLIASQEENREGDTITVEEELKAALLKIEELTTELEGFKKSKKMSASTIDELNETVTKLSASVTEKETGITELTASKESLEKEVAAKTALIASLEIEKAGSLPMDKLNERIAAAIAEHDKDVFEKNVLSAARSKFVEARAGLGVETKPDEFTTLSAADFEKMTETLGVKIAAGGAGSGIKYPADDSTGNSDFATGAYDKNSRTWSK